MSQSIATAYIKKELSKTGTEVQVDIRGNMNNAVIVKPPFYRQGTHK
jgi:aminomethyltransferase